MKVNCSKGYSDTQKEKLFEWDENHVLDKTVWESLPSPSVEVFKSPKLLLGLGQTQLCVSQPRLLCLRLPSVPLPTAGSAAHGLCVGRDGQEHRALRRAACWLVLPGFSWKGFPCWAGGEAVVLGAMYHGRTVPGSAAWWQSGSNRLFVPRGSGSWH